MALSLSLATLYPLFNGLAHMYTTVRLHTRLQVRGWGIYSGFLFTYSGLQCPMEQLHRRKSLLHNFAAGSILGYIGVSGGFVGIPFMQNVTLPKVLRSRQAFLGAGIYGTLAMAFGAFSGKPF